MESFLLSEEKQEINKDKQISLEDDIDMFQDQQSDKEVKQKNYEYFKIICINLI